MESGKRPRGGVRGIQEGVPSLGGEHLTSEGGFDLSRPKYVPDDFAASIRRGRIRAGDVLIVKDGATTGKTALVRDDFPHPEAVANEHLFVCRPLEGLSSRFIAEFLRSPEGQRRVLSHFKGAAQGGINREFAAGTVVPVPPAAEQRRIADRLDEVESRRESVVAYLQSARAGLKRLRGEVLSAVYTGRLTADWRERHPPSGSEGLPALARERRRAEDKRFAVPPLNPHAATSLLPEAWEIVPLGLVLRGLKYGTSKRSAYDQPGVGVLRIPNVSAGVLDIEDLKFANLDQREMDGLRLEEGDLLMIRSNGSVRLVGKTASVTSAGEGMAYAGYLIRLRVDRELMDPAFLRLLLASPQLRRQIEIPARSTSGVHNINREEIRALGLPLAPRAEQDEIVRRATGALEVIERLSAKLNDLEATLHRIHQAAQEKAFRGDLVATEATLAAAENRDFESAAELLRRI